MWNHFTHMHQYSGDKDMAKLRSTTMEKSPGGQNWGEPHLVLEITPNIALCTLMLRLAQIGGFVISWFGRILKCGFINSEALALEKSCYCLCEFAPAYCHLLTTLASNSYKPNEKWKPTKMWDGKYFHKKNTSLLYSRHCFFSRLKNIFSSSRLKNIWKQKMEKGKLW